MIGVYIAIATLGLTILGLVIKLTTFSTEIRVWVEEMRKEIREDRKPLRRLPTLEYRVATLEKRLEVGTPDLSDTAHDAEE